MTKLTDHAGKRKSQRGISMKLINITMSYGKVILRQGYVFYVLTFRSIPKSICSKLRDKAEGMVVVWKDEKIITTYKNRKSVSKIKRKSKTKK